MHFLALDPVRAMLGTHPEEGSLIKETSAAIDVAFFILMVGGFLGVVVNENWYAEHWYCFYCEKKYKGREKNVDLVLMPLFALDDQLVRLCLAWMMSKSSNRISPDVGLSIVEIQLRSVVFHYH